MVTKPITNLEQRNEWRDHKQLFLRIRALDEENTQDAIVHTTDISDSGIGLFTHKPYPLGTRIVISKGGKFIAIGEVVNLHEEWDSWDWCGIDRMGVRFLEKSNHWPLQ